MKFFVAILIGLAAGYSMGYKDAHAGRPTVVARALDKFGVNKVKSANERRGQEIDSVR